MKSLRNPDHGAASREAGSHGCRDEWRMAAEMDVAEPCAPGARWAPARSVFVDPDIGPRGLNWETVHHYQELYLELPPIDVQRETFTLIDGRHRWEAVAAASRPLIRVREVDVADEELAERAFLSNLNHGLPYTLSERVHGLRMLLERHADWSNGKLVRMLGISHETVAKYRAQIQGGSARDDQVSGNRIPQPAHSSRVGLDGKAYPVAGQRPAGHAPVGSYDPGPEREPDDNDVWDEADGEPSPAHIVVPTSRITAEQGLNPAAFRVGDVVRSVHTGEKFEVGPTGRDGCARFRGLGGARDCTPNALSNPHYVLVMAAPSSPAEPAVAGRPDRGFTYVADGIAMRGSVPAGVSWEAVERLESAFNTFLRSL